MITKGEGEKEISFLHVCFYQQPRKYPTAFFFQQDQKRYLNKMNILRKLSDVVILIDVNVTTIQLIFGCGILNIKVVPFLTLRYLLDGLKFDGIF